jgi:hypothetical protein
VQPQREVREQRMTRTERPSRTKELAKSSRYSEPRSIQRAERTERPRPQLQPSRGSGSERKSASIEKRSSQNRVEKRDVAKVKGSRSEKGRGKAR